MKFPRRVLVVLMAVFMMLLPCATAVAANAAPATNNEAIVADTNVTSTDTPETTDVTPRQSVGKLLASGAANFYGDGSIDVYLSSGNSWADIQAGTGGSSATGAVNVSVKFPNGQWYELGQIFANADHTSYNEFSYCPKGTYHFVFENTNNDWIQVYANIYD